MDGFFLVASQFFTAVRSILKISVRRESQNIGKVIKNVFF